MNCPVCYQPAEELPARGNFIEVKCLGCGHFRVGGALLPKLSSFYFDVRRARQRLVELRQKAPLPMLGAVDEVLLLRK